MKIGGMQKSSLIDYPDHICAIVWTIGCNFRCPYCYNVDLVRGTAKEMPKEEVFGILEERKNLLEAVTITGGEPTIQKDLPQFLEKIKKMNYKIKIDTNGTNPKMIGNLIKNNLVDYIAMDIKAPLEKYKNVVKAKVDKNKIKKSIKIIKNTGKENKIDYEFRTTVVPDLIKKGDIIKISNLLKGSKKYYLQQFQKMGELLDRTFEKKTPYKTKKLKEFCELIKNKFKECEIRDGSS